MARTQEIDSEKPFADRFSVFAIPPYLLLIATKLKKVLMPNVKMSASEVFVAVIGGDTVLFGVDLSLNALIADKTRGA